MLSELRPSAQPVTALAKEEQSKSVEVKDPLSLCGIPRFRRAQSGRGLPTEWSKRDPVGIRDPVKIPNPIALTRVKTGSGRLQIWYVFEDPVKGPDPFRIPHPCLLGGRLVGRVLPGGARPPVADAAAEVHNLVNRLGALSGAAGVYLVTVPRLPVPAPMGSGSSMAQPGGL